MLCPMCHNYHGRDPKCGVHGDKAINDMRIAETASYYADNVGDAKINDVTIIDDDVMMEKIKLIVKPECATPTECRVTVDFPNLYELPTLVNSGAGFCNVCGKMFGLTVTNGGITATEIDENEDT